MTLNTNKEKGRACLSVAIAYFGSNGYTLSIPLNDTQDYDLVVDKDNLIIGFGDTRQQILFNSVEVGKAVLKQQEQTQEKIKEESSRMENQKLIEGELGRG